MNQQSSLVAGVSALALLGLSACSDDSTVTVRMPKAPAATVVYRDGDGPWTAATGAAGSVRFDAPSGRYTVVVGCNYGDDGRAEVYAMTTAELSTIDYQAACGGETQVISGATNAAATAFIYVGQRGATLANGSYMLEAPRGTADVVAIGGGRVVIARDVSLGASPVSLDIDFNAASAADLIRREVTLSSIKSGTTAYGGLWTGGGTYASLCSSSGTSACGVSAAALAPDDLHVVGVVAGGNGPYRYARWAVHEPTDREIIFPLTTLTPAEVALANQGTKVAMQVSWPGAPSAPLYRVIASQYSELPPYRYWELVASEGFVSGGGNLSLPDLAGATGWDQGLELTASRYVEWQVVAETGAPLDEMVRWYPTQESTILGDGFAGAVTPQ